MLSVSARTGDINEGVLGEKAVLTEAYVMLKYICDIQRVLSHLWVFAEDVSGRVARVARCD